MVDLTKIEPGDKFTIEVTARAPVGIPSDPAGPCVYRSNSGLLFILVSDVPNAQLNVDKINILSHTPAPRRFKRGDRVSNGVVSWIWVVEVFESNEWFVASSSHILPEKPDRSCMIRMIKDYRHVD